MPSFITPMIIMEFILVLRALSCLRREHYINDSSEEMGALKGSPIAQPLMDASDLDLKTQALVRQTDQHDSHPPSAPREEGSCGSSESNKVNREDLAQVNNYKKDRV